MSLPPPNHNPYAPYAPVHTHQAHVQHYHVPGQMPQAPPAAQQPPQQGQPAATVAPGDTYTAQAGGAGQQSPLVAQGDWTKNLVHLAKTAELKKHALTLQLHTAHILSAHSTLESKNKALQDIKEQKNRLESERNRLLNCLREVNEDRDKADLMETSIKKECAELHAKIQSITDSDYTTAKREVDALRAELGQPPVPGLQQTLEEKSAAYLNERRLNGSAEPSPVSAGAKRTASDAAANDTPGKRPRGRPKGSKNKVKPATAVGVPGANAGAAPNGAESGT